MAPEHRENVSQGVKQAIQDGTFKPRDFTSEDHEKSVQWAKENLTGVPRPPEVVAAFHSPESRAKAATVRIGRKLSHEACAKIAAKKKAWWAAHPNHKFSLDRNTKIADNMKGKVPLAALAKAHSPETEAKRQETRRLQKCQIL